MRVEPRDQFPQRLPGGKHSRIVQWILARYAADAVGPEKLPGHDKNQVKNQKSKGKSERTGWRRAFL